MNKATDRDRWQLTPQTVNAYYHPLLNEIVFPAAILQAPFFDANGDAAANFGTFGAVVGHEMIHGYDDAGRKFDAEGNQRDWWADGDGEEYTRRADVIIQQANEFMIHGVNMKGKLVCFLLLRVIIF
jgi:predicted metalloendopeptidase